MCSCFGLFFVCILICMLWIRCTLHAFYFFFSPVYFYAARMLDWVVRRVCFAYIFFNLHEKYMGCSTLRNFLALPCSSWMTWLGLWVNVEVFPKSEVQFLLQMGQQAPYIVKSVYTSVFCALLSCLLPNIMVCSSCFQAGRWNVIGKSLWKKTVGHVNWTRRMPSSIHPCTHSPYGLSRPATTLTIFSFHSILFTVRWTAAGSKHPH